MCISKIQFRNTVYEVCMDLFISGCGCCSTCAIREGIKGLCAHQNLNVPISKAMIIETLYLLCVGVGALLVIFISLGFYANYFVIPVIPCLLLLLLFLISYEFSSPYCQNGKFIYPQSHFNIIS